MSSIIMGNCPEKIDRYGIMFKHYSDNHRLNMEAGLKITELFEEIEKDTKYVLREMTGESMEVVPPEEVSNYTWAKNRFYMLFNTYPLPPIVFTEKNDFYSMAKPRRNNTGVVRIPSDEEENLHIYIPAILYDEYAHSEEWLDVMSNYMVASAESLMRMNKKRVKKKDKIISEFMIKGKIEQPEIFDPATIMLGIMTLGHGDIARIASYFFILKMASHIVKSEYAKVLEKYGIIAHPQRYVDEARFLRYLHLRTGKDFIGLLSSHTLEEALGEYADIARETWDNADRLYEEMQWYIFNEYTR